MNDGRGYDVDYWENVITVMKRVFTGPTDEEKKLFEKIITVEIPK